MRPIRITPTNNNTPENAYAIACSCSLKRRFALVQKPKTYPSNSINPPAPTL